HHRFSVLRRPGITSAEAAAGSAQCLHGGVYCDSGRPDRSKNHAGVEGEIISAFDHHRPAGAACERQPTGAGTAKVTYTPSDGSPPCPSHASSAGGCPSGGERLDVRDVSNDFNTDTTTATAASAPRVWQQALRRVRSATNRSRTTAGGSRDADTPAMW